LPYLNQLAQYVPSAGNIKRYAELVRERAILRKLIAVGDQISASGFNGEGKPVATLLDEAEKRVFKIGEEGSRLTQGFHSLEHLVVDLIAKVEERADNPSDVTGLRSGFYDLDRMTSGLQAGDLIILAARPSMGKTSFAINIAEHVALHERLPVAVFSMEMGAAQLAVRIVGSIGRINQTHLRTGRLADEEWPRLAEAIDQLRGVQLHIDETPGLTVSELRSNARRLARMGDGKLGLDRGRLPAAHDHQRGFQRGEPGHGPGRDFARAQDAGQGTGKLPGDCALSTQSRAWSSAPTSGR
jgi:replicative DNA helicase